MLLSQRQKKQGKPDGSRSFNELELLFDLRNLATISRTQRAICDGIRERRGRTTKRRNLGLLNVNVSEECKRRIVQSRISRYPRQTDSPLIITGIVLLESEDIVGVCLLKNGQILDW